MWLTVALVNGYLCLMCFLGPLVYDTAKYGNGEFCKLLLSSVISCSHNLYVKMAYQATGAGFRTNTQWAK